MSVIGALVTLGTGIASAISSYTSKKREAEKARALASDLEANRINAGAYKKKIADLYNQLGEKAIGEIKTAFGKRANQMRQFIQQRRIPEYLTQLSSLPEQEQEAITKLMLNIESAKLGKELDISRTAFSQAGDTARLITDIDRIYGGQPTAFSQFLGSFTQPFVTQTTRDIGQKLLKGSEAQDVRSGTGGVFQPIDETDPLVSQEDEFNPIAEALG